MPKYRKKPVVIEAVQWTGTNPEEICEFAGRAIGYLGSAGLKIVTLEDGPEQQVEHWASYRDYIIKGVQGEFYACKESIFEATYDAVR